jgi:hypothetical protein
MEYAIVHAFFKGWRRRTAAAIVLLSIAAMIAWDHYFSRRIDHVYIPFQSPFVCMIVSYKGFVTSFYFRSKLEDPGWSFEIPTALLFCPVSFPIAFLVLRIPLIRFKTAGSAVFPEKSTRG